MRRTAVAVAVLGAVSSAAVSATAHAGELRVAVMEFTNAGAGNDAYDLAALGKGLQSMITTDLSQLPAFKVVERERLRDIQSELKLQRGKAIDPSTASKIGKLAGASHLFTGSFTVVGDKMRIDGRLISVTDGGVVFAEQSSGAKDAFFELEQALVKKIIDGTNVKLAPKERAQLARPQTADFEAFKKYSVGLANFDDKKYDDALKSLKEATELDKEFKLAALTLDEYERLAAKLRSRAEDVQRGNLDALRKEKSQAVKDRIDVIARLWPIAEGKVTVPGVAADAKVQRLFATCRLMNLYHHHLWDGGEQIPDDALARAGLDPFVLERTADALARRYYAESSEVFPKAPIVCASPLMGDAKLTPATFDKDFGYAIGHLEDITKGYGLNEMFRYHTPNEADDWFLKRLHIDRGERLRAVERMWKLLAQKLDPAPKWRADFEKALGIYARENANLEQSTAHFVSIGKLAKADESALRNAADEVERNKKVAIGLADKNIGKLYRELVISNRADQDLDYFQRVLGGPWTDNKRDKVKAGRDLTLWTEYTIFGAVPVWPQQWEGKTGLASGPRTDRLRSDEIRYAGEKATSGDVIVAGAMPKSVGEVKVKIGWKVPEDFYYPRGKNAGPAPRAAAGIIVGLRNVGFNSEDALKVAPTRGFAVLVGDKGVQLVELKRVNNNSDGMTWTVREEKPLALGSVDKVELEVSAANGNIDAKVNGQRVSFKTGAKDGTDGLVGLVTRGVGYAGLSDLKLSTRR